MPAYDYRCKDCKHRFTLTYKSIAAYTEASPLCPRCASANLSRVINRVRMARSEDSRLDSLDSLAGLDALENLDDADRFLIRMQGGENDQVGRGQLNFGVVRSVGARLPVGHDVGEQPLIQRIRLRIVLEPDVGQTDLGDEIQSAARQRPYGAGAGA